MAQHSALFALSLTASVMLAAGAAQSSFAADIVHTQTDESPIAKMVTVPAGATTYYLSGMVAPVSNPNAPKGSIESYGDTKTQTIGTIGEIRRALASKTPEEDRSISLFTRVAIRYASLTPRMLVAPNEPAILLQSLPPLPFAK